MGEDKPSPLAASRVRLQCLGESTDGEVIDPVKARSSLEASKEWARISLHLWLPLGLGESTVRLQCLGESTDGDGEVIDPVKARSSLEASKEWARISLHLWLPLG